MLDARGGGARGEERESEPLNASLTCAGLDLQLLERACLRHDCINRVFFRSPIRMGPLRVVVATHASHGDNANATKKEEEEEDFPSFSWKTI